MTTFETLKQQVEMKCEPIEVPNPFLVFTGKGIDKIVAYRKGGGMVEIVDIIDIQLTSDKMFILGMNTLETDKKIHTLPYQDHIIIIED